MFDDDPNALAGKKPGVFDPSAGELHPWIKRWLFADAPRHDLLITPGLLDGDAALRMSVR
ncbi:hypothetical protein KBK24_0117015 [Burkholderia sp. K24]|nr:hypothetical protein KBK24_0117015 [Burkholderia sp. K24]